MISYGKHNIEQTDIDAVVEVLQSQMLTQGSQVPAFEKALTEYTQAKYCVAVNSGTSGLHVACLALGIGPDDWVWTSPNSFAASANCALYCGANIDFVDINLETRNICPKLLEAKLLQASQQDKLPKAIVVVHFAGASCDMQAIQALCKPLNVAIIEDAAHALGATYQQKPVGGCQYSDIAVLSFHPVKSITTAEGGAVTTNNAHLAEQCMLFAKHGITRDPELMQGDSRGDWFYQQLCLGFNYRLSDIHAALGISQLKRIDSFIRKRRHLADKYLEALANLPIKLPSKNDLATSSWHLFMIELTQHDRQQVYTQLHQKGIGVNVHYIPIHLHPYYQSLGFSEGQFPVAEHFYNNALTIPLFVDLSEQQQRQVIQALTDILS